LQSVINNISKVILQWGGMSFSNKTEQNINFPTVFSGYYTVMATDVGSARVVYACGHSSVSFFKLFSPYAQNIGCRWLAIGC